MAQNRVSAGDVDAGVHRPVKTGIAKRHWTGPLARGLSLASLWGQAPWGTEDRFPSGTRPQRTRSGDRLLPGDGLLAPAAQWPLRVQAV
jgi:hypothetical protein